jgi:hypothetical protein
LDIEPYKEDESREKKATNQAHGRNLTRFLIDKQREQCQISSVLAMGQRFYRFLMRIELPSSGLPLLSLVRQR